MDDSSAEASDITGLLIAWRDGDRSAFERLIPLVYPHLKRVAHRHLIARRGGQTLGTTSLVHETYLKFVDQSRVALSDRGHFFAVASRAMRQVVVDHALRHARRKRGAGVRPLPLDGRELPIEEEAEALLAVHEALSGLEGLDPRLVRVVEHRFFAGLTREETAEALAVSTATVDRDWYRARAWLRKALDAGGAP